MIPTCVQCVGNSGSRGIAHPRSAQFVVGWMIQYRRNIRTGVVARTTCPSTKPVRRTRKDALLNKGASMGIDTRKVALEIVAVLHKNKIPIDLIQPVFYDAMKLINHYTIPNKPSFLDTIANASLATTDRDIDANG